MKAGSGPRHLTFSPNGHYAYLINELSGTVIAFEYKDGDLKEMQTIAADTVNAQGSADIHISPDGKFLYASNRLKADGIAIFNIHPDNGMLSKAGYQLTGIHPRNFIITPNGKYLLVACRDSWVNDKLMYLVCAQVIGKQVFTIWSDTDTMQMWLLLSFLIYSRAFEFYNIGSG